MASERAYRPEDLLRFVDCLDGALVPGTDAVIYVANTLDGATASGTSALWLAERGEHRRLAPAEAAPGRPAVSPDGKTVAFLQQSGSEADAPWQLCVCPAVRRRGHGPDQLRPRHRAGRPGLVARRHAARR